MPWWAYLTWLAAFCVPLWLGRAQRQASREDGEGSPMPSRRFCGCYPDYDTGEISMCGWHRWRARKRP
jgi:hypothetical protein